MFLMERPTFAARGVQSRTSVQRRTRIRPSISTSTSSPLPEFVDEVPYGALGKLMRNRVTQPKPAHTADIVRWIARQPEPGRTGKMQDAVMQTHPDWFRSWDALWNYEQSLRLPRGEILMDIDQDPLRLRGDPPSCIVQRWEDAMVRYPHATMFYMEPYFDEPDSPKARALTPSDMEKTSGRQWEQIFRSVALFGGLIRWQDRRAKLIEARRLSRLTEQAYQQREAYGALMAKLIQRVKTGAMGLDDATAELREQPLSAAVTLGFVPAVLNRDIRTPELLAEIEKQRTAYDRRLRSLRREVRVGAIAHPAAIEQLGGAEFDLIRSLGLVRQVEGRLMFRFDPVAAIELDGQLLTIGHWDRWMVDVGGGRMEMRTFIHI